MINNPLKDRAQSKAIMTTERRRKSYNWNCVQGLRCSHILVPNIWVKLRKKPSIARGVKALAFYLHRLHFRALTKVQLHDGLRRL